MARSLAKRDTDREPNSRALPKLRLPIWWYAPFLDSSSFGNEATALIQSLLHTGLAEPSKMWISLLQVGLGCRGACAHGEGPGARLTSRLV